MEKLKKNVLKSKNDIAQSVHEALSSDGANYDLEGNDSRNVLSQFRLKLRLFSTNYISNCSIRSRISTYQVFFKYCFTNPWFQLPQNVLRSGEMTRVISTGLNGVSLVHHIF